MLKLTRKATYHGPNPCSTEPVVVAELALDDGVSAKARAIVSEMAEATGSWFTDEPTGRFASPGSPSEPSDHELLADFLLRWALSALTALKGYLHASGYRQTGAGTFRLWIGFHRPQVSYAALMLAVGLANDLAEGRGIGDRLDPLLQKLWVQCRRHHPDSSDEIAMTAARAGDIPWLPAWGQTYVWQFGWCARSRVISSAASNEDGYVAGRLMANKLSGKLLIESLGLPTPKYAMVPGDGDIPAAVDRVGFPCVVKPVDGGGGKGISAGLTKLDEVRAAVAYARRFSRRPIMVEAMAEGGDHRLMVVEGRFAGAFRRAAPVVTGDGRRTVRELIEEANQGRALPGVFAVSKLSRIELDDSAVRHLAGKDLSPDSVLAAGQEVRVRSNDNLSTGGFSTDLTARTHSDVREIAEALARTLDVNMAGFDYLTTDISRSWRDVPGTFIELNLTPGLAVLTLAGRSPVEVGKLALGSKPGRIPLNLVVLPDAQLGDAESAISQRAPGREWGLASHDKAWLGSMPLLVGKRGPWSGVMTLLSHQVVEQALLLVSSRQLTRHGLPVDRADRVWICADNLPSEWLEVLKHASALPVWHGAWRDLQATAEFSDQAKRRMP